MSEDKDLDQHEVRRVLEAILAQGPSSLGLTQDDFQQLGIMGPQGLDATTVAKILDILLQAGLVEVDRIGPEFLVRPTLKARRSATGSQAPPRAESPKPAPPAPREVTPPAVSKVEIGTPAPSLPPSAGESSLAPRKSETGEPRATRVPEAPTAPIRSSTEVEIETRLVQLKERERALQDKESELAQLLERARATTANLDARQRELDDREGDLDDLGEKLTEQSRNLAGLMAQVVSTQEGLSKVVARARSGGKAPPSEP